MSGRESSLVACRRVGLVCASGDRRENVVCVTCCAAEEVRGLPARRAIKSGCFRPAMSTGQQLV